MKILSFLCWLALAAPVFAATSLGVREPLPPGISTGQVPVVLATDAAAVAMQADVLFDEDFYTVNDAVEGEQPQGVLLRSRLVEPGRLRVVVFHRSGGDMVSDVVFQVPLTAKNGVVSDDPVVLTNFQVVGHGGVLSTSLQPKVRLVGLRDGRNLNGRKGIELSVEASATAGTITRVEYFVGGVPIGDGTGLGFRLLWSPEASGPHEITAVAYDSNGAKASTRSIPVFVTHVGTFDGPVFGSYAGLVRGETFDFSKDGFVSMTSTTAGKFTLKMLVGGKAFSGRGTFDEEGNATVQISPGKGLVPWTVVLAQSSTPPVDQIHGRVADGIFANGKFSGNTFETEFTVDRKRWDGKLKVAMQHGSYTVLLPAAASASVDSAPHGTGYGRVTVGKDGTARLTASLADGAAVTASSWISKDNQWPIYASLYRAKGVLMGTANFLESEKISDFSAHLTWMRPADSKAPLFKTGFLTRPQALGGLFIKPTALARLVPMANAGGNAMLYLTEGGLPMEGLARFATVTGANKVLVPLQEADMPAVALAGLTGLFSGSFLHPATQKRIVFKGAAFQPQGLMAGYFVNSSEGGDVRLEPNPDLPPGEGDAGPLGAEPLPVVKFTAPKAASTLATGGIVQIKGTAADKQGISNVRVQVLHNGVLSEAATAVGTTDWTHDLLVPIGEGGLYAVFARATDTSGDESEVTAAHFWVALKKDLLVTVDGPGTVKGFEGTTQRDVGKAVILTATPAKGKKFLGWSGGIASSSPKITVMMKEGLTLEASFGD